MYVLRSHLPLCLAVLFLAGCQTLTPASPVVPAVSLGTQISTLIASTTATTIPTAEQWKDTRKAQQKYLDESAEKNKTSKTNNATPKFILGVGGILVGLVTGVLGLQADGDSEAANIGAIGALITGAATGVTVLFRFDSRHATAEQCENYLTRRSGRFMTEWPDAVIEVAVSTQDVDQWNLFRDEVTNTNDDIGELDCKTS